MIWLTGAEKPPVKGGALTGWDLSGTGNANGLLSIVKYSPKSREIQGVGLLFFDKSDDLLNANWAGPEVFVNYACKTVQNLISLH